MVRDPLCDPVSHDRDVQSASPLHAFEITEFVLEASNRGLYKAPHSLSLRILTKYSHTVSASEHVCETFAVSRVLGSVLDG